MKIATIYLIAMCFVVDSVSGIALIKESSCHKKDNRTYFLMGTKTNYDLIRGDDSISSNHKACRPVKVWSLNRHGTRISGPNTMEDFKQLPLLKDTIIKNHEENYLGCLHDDELNILKSWEWDSSLEDKANTLTKQGWKELEMIASRYRKRFPSIYHQKYNESKFYFRFTDEQRTEASCKAYVSGLFGEDISKVKLEKPQARDPILRPYKNCTLWKKGYNNTENLEFAESPAFQKMLKHVSDRLGFSELLDARTTVVMYEMCRYQKAWYPSEVSPWCVVFTRDDLIVLEYYDDLIHYYKSGHGRAINRQVGCASVKDMIEKFRAHIEGTAHVPDVVSYFTHDTMLLLTLTTLGVAQDVELLRADNYERMQNRQWRTSMIAAFATNIVAVLHECSDSEDRYRVQFYLNEKPLKVCKGRANDDSQSWCSWKELQKRLNSSLQCSLNACNDILLYESSKIL